MQGIEMMFFGRLGKDAQKFEHNGRAFLSLVVAVSERRKAQDGKYENTTTWVNCTWNTDGGNILPYLTKGTTVLVKGRPRTRLYTDKQGQQQCALECSISDFSLISTNKDKEQAYATDVAEQNVQPAQMPSAVQNAVNTLQNIVNGGGDDLPF